MMMKKWTAFAMAMLLSTAIQTPLFAHGDKAHGEISPQALDALYASYLSIQEALAKDDLETAQKESRGFLKQPVKFPAELSHNVKADDVLGDFKALNKAKDIAAYRKSFSPFSDRMSLLMSEAKYKGERPVLVYECPMANRNKGGKWLQAEKGVANPYFGAEMPMCGSLMDTLHEGMAAKEPDAEKAADGHGRKMQH